MKPWYGHIWSSNATTELPVQEIIDRADVGRSTFYAHYRDKEDVLVSESQRVLALFQQQQDPAGAGDQGLLPSLYLFQHIGVRHDLYHALVRGHGINVLYEACHRYLKISVGQRLAVLAQEIASPRSHFRSWRTMSASTFLNLARWWLEQQRPYSPEEMDSISSNLSSLESGREWSPTGAENIPSASHPQRHSPPHEKGREPQQKDRHRERA